MLKVGDKTRCPQCSKVGRVVWVSHDGTRAGIRCLRRHNQLIRGHSIFGSHTRLEIKRKNMVFLMEIEPGTPTPR